MYLELVDSSILHLLAEEEEAEEAGAHAHSPEQLRHPLQPRLVPAPPPLISQMRVRGRR